MKRLVIAAAALGLPAPAFGASYKIVLDRPANGRLLFGHAGLQAADERTPATSCGSSLPAMRSSSGAPSGCWS